MRCANRGPRPHLRLGLFAHTTSPDTLPRRTRKWKDEHDFWTNLVLTVRAGKRRTVRGANETYVQGGKASRPEA